MAKVVLDWKAPSERKIKEFVGELPDKDKKDFVVTCLEKKNNKNVLNKPKARKWLTSKFDNTDDIEWKGRPEKREKRMSAVDEMAEWFNL